MTSGAGSRSVGERSGRPPTSLTPRQREALAAYARTGNQREAAERLGIGYQTVKNHLAAAYAALDVGGAIDAFRAMGWLVVR
jgi:DNA-binding CsgD family transcriptional regulator